MWSTSPNLHHFDEEQNVMNETSEKANRTTSELAKVITTVNMTAEYVETTEETIMVTTPKKLRAKRTIDEKKTLVSAKKKQDSGMFGD